MGKGRGRITDRGAAVEITFLMPPSTDWPCHSPPDWLITSELAWREKKCGLLLDRGEIPRRKKIPRIRVSVRRKICRVYKAPHGALNRPLEIPQILAFKLILKSIRFFLLRYIFPSFLAALSVQIYSNGLQHVFRWKQERQGPCHGLGYWSTNLGN